MSKAFIQDLANGNVQAAQQKCTSDISLPSLTANSVTMKAWGGLKDTTFLGFKDESSTGAGRHTVVTGTATFNNGTTKGVVVELVKEGEVWKIKSFALQ